MGKLGRAGVAAVAVLALGACSAEQAPPAGGQASTAPVPVETSTSPSPMSSTTPTAAPSTTPRRPSADDLTGASLQHTVESDGLSVSIEYAPDKPAAEWTAEGAKPVQVSVTVTNNRRPEQKVFVTRATMRFTVSDGVDDIPGPEPLVDTANITPGYLATFPYSYNQSFAVPSLDVSTRTLTIDLKLEMVSLVDAKAKDYTKQTVTDSVRAEVAF